MKARIIHPLAPNEQDAWSPGNRVRGILENDELDGRLSLTEVVMRRGEEPPLCRHQHEDVVIHVLDGELTLCVDGERFPASRGTYALLPRGSEHGYAIESERARLLVMLTPAGAEGCLAELHEAFHAASPGDGAGSGEVIEHLLTTAARFGIDITGPPPATT